MTTKRKTPDVSASVATKIVELVRSGLKPAAIQKAIGGNVPRSAVNAVYTATIAAPVHTNGRNKLNPEHVKWIRRQRFQARVNGKPPTYPEIAAALKKEFGVDVTPTACRYQATKSVTAA